jgi:cysteine desulfurase
VYFDNAATTRVRDEVRDIMITMMCEDYGNPSSSHLMGRRAKAAVDLARKQLAGALGASPEEINFTSGGTEADNWAVLGAAGALAGGGRHMITDLAEHEAVRKSAERLERSGWDVTYLRPGKDGRIAAESFAGALREDTALASVMLVYIETGALNPFADMRRALRRRGL